MPEKCSYCGEEGHSIQNCPKWRGKQTSPQNVIEWHGATYYAYGSAARPLEWLTIKDAITTVAHPALVRLSRSIDYSAEVPYFNILLSPLALSDKEVKSLELESISKEDMHRWRITRSAEVATATETEVGVFTDPLLGRCGYTGFYIVNEMYGGYSANCEKGSISVDYANPLDIINLAQKALMPVHLAGGVWEDVGKKGWGETVAPSEAEKLLRELSQKRGIPLREEHSSPPKRVYISPAELVSLSSQSSGTKRFEVTYLDAAGRKHTEEIEDDIAFYQRVRNEGLSVISIRKI